MSNALMRERRREATAAMTAAAWTAWLQGAGDNKTWGDFCKHYGLVEKDAPKAINKDKINNIYKWADSIAELAQNKK